MNGRTIGERDFTDGTRRPVFLDADGRQFVSDEGQPVFGVWLLTDDVLTEAPIIVDAEP